ncbi:MAG TPA: aminodeoxychorismate lyase [Verrucomicrobiae bacterium]|nr:aminodeoxychorismate lyase [Verrucomicrobiae bacterium]
MLVYLNGRFVPEEQAMVSVFDRSFLYGDGLFETMLVANGQIFRWELHADRLMAGADFLKIKLPESPAQLSKAVGELIRANGIFDGVLRLTLSRGTGVRGYSPRQATSPFVVMTLHTADGNASGTLVDWHLRTSSFKLPAAEPVSQYKTCNKLAQVLARAEAEQLGADEALLLNTDGFVVEAASANLFWVVREKVFTPPLAAGVLSGVTRRVVLELCCRLGLEVSESNIAATELSQADGVFLSLSTLGIVQGASLDGVDLRVSPVTERLRSRYFELVQQETAVRE